MVSAVAVRTAGGKGVLPDEIGSTACFTHVIIEVTHGGDQIGKSQLVHQGADTAAAETCLKATVVRIRIEIHIPGIRVAVGRLQIGSSLHPCEVLRGILLLSTQTTGVSDERSHHCGGIERRQVFDAGSLGHTQHKGGEHCTVDEIFPEPVSSFKFRQFCDDLLVLWLCQSGDGFGLLWGQTKLERQMLLKGRAEQRPHCHRHTDIFHNAYSSIL